MLFKNPLTPHSSILIDGQVIDAIYQFAQRTAQAREAGGILLGLRRGVHLHIVEATAPQRFDTRTPLSFDRNDDWHQQIAIDRWAQSGKTMDYLGEWHTHPQAMPTPSHLDVMEWRKICDATRQSMVFIIVGTKSHWVGAGDNGRRILRAA